MDADGYYKVWLLFDNLNKGERFFHHEKEFSVDESMIAYYGKHSSKQFIHGKPIRYGYKVWTMATSKGAGVRFEPYCAKDTQLKDTGLGLGPNVVLGLVEKAGIKPGSEVYMDNLFTTFPLLEKLSERRIGVTGTIHQNRLNKIPIKSKKDMEKKDIPCGEIYVLYKSDQVLVGWKDNKAVYMGSNQWSEIDGGPSMRWSRDLKKKVGIPTPQCIKKYNTFMGGVDLLDNMVNCYRVKYRSKKWWWAFYSWSLNVQAVQAWRLRCRMKEELKSEPLLSFIRELVIEMMNVHGHPPMKRTVTVSGSMRVLDSLRYDAKNHWPVANRPGKDGKPARQNCKQCYDMHKKESRSSYQCSKCMVSLHLPECLTACIYSFPTFLFFTFHILQLL